MFALTGHGAGRVRLRGVRAEGREGEDLRPAGGEGGGLKGQAAVRLACPATPPTGFELAAKGSVPT